MRLDDMQFTVDKSNPSFIRIQFDHIWHQISDYYDLKDYKIIFSKITPSGIYQILEYTEPNEHDGRYIYKLVNYAVNDSGSMSIFAVDLCRSEALEMAGRQIC